jgi:hypothetical protein
LLPAQLPQRMSVLINAIAMGAAAACSEHCNELFLNILGDGVLQVFGLIVNLVPLDTQHFMEQAFPQVVAKTQPVGDPVIFPYTWTYIISLARASLKFSISNLTFAGLCDGSGTAVQTHYKRLRSPELFMFTGAIDFDLDAGVE